MIDTEIIDVLINILKNLVLLKIMVVIGRLIGGNIITVDRLVPKPAHLMMGMIDITEKTEIEEVEIEETEEDIKLLQLHLVLMTIITMDTIAFSDQLEN